MRISPTSYGLSLFKRFSLISNIFILVTPPFTIPTYIFVSLAYSSHNCTKQKLICIHETFFAKKMISLWHLIDIFLILCIVLIQNFITCLIFYRSILIGRLRVKRFIKFQYVNISLSKIIRPG